MNREETLEDLARRVRRLEDEAAIRRLMAEMLRKADERDRPDWGDRLVAYYTEDGMWTSGKGFSDVGMAGRGREALRKKFNAGTRIVESSHLLGSEWVEVDGDEAEGSWLCFEPATLKAPGGGREAVWVMGRYHCEFKREGDGWKVRTLSFDGIFCTPFDKGWAEQPFVSVHPEAADG